MSKYHVPILEKDSWQLPVIDKDLTTPPVSPTKGDRYLIITGDTGTDWAGYDNYITYYDGTNWQFVTPLEGMMAYVKDENKLYQYITSWEIYSSGSGSASGNNLTKDITQTSHGFSVGNVLKFDGSNYAKAKADSDSNAEVVGIVSKVTDSDNFTLLLSGYISGLSSLTAGTVYFLSDSIAGDLTATETTTEGSISKPLLVAISTTEGYFINYRGVEITDSSSFYGSFTNSDLSSGILTVTHNLGHTYCSVTVVDNNDKVIIPDEINYTNSNSLTIDLTSFGTITGTWRYIILDVGAANTTTPHKIQDNDADTYIDTEATTDDDNIVFKNVGVETGRIYSSGIIDFPKQSCARAWLNTSQTIVSSTWTTVLLDSENYDVQNEMDITTNKGRFTVTKAGKYLVNVNVAYNGGSADTEYYAVIRKNGNDMAYFRLRFHSTSAQNVFGSDILDCSDNDYIELATFQITGSNQTLVNNGGHTFMSIMKIG